MRLSHYILILILILILFPIQLNYGQGRSDIKNKIETLVKQDQTGTLNNDNAIGQLIDLYRQSKEKQYKEEIVKSGTCLMRLYIRKGEYKNAIDLTNQLLEYAPSLDMEDSAEVYRIQALAYSSLGLLEKSHKQYLKALTYAKQIPDKDIRHYRTCLLYENMTSYFDEKKNTRTPSLIIYKIVLKKQSK